MAIARSLTKKAKRTENPPTKKYKGKKHVPKQLHKYDNIDVKTLQDVEKLTELIKNNVLTLLLVYADWCGHCTTFKNDIWKHLHSFKGRKMPMAQVNEQMLEHLMKLIPGFKVDGYPTSALVGKDMKVAMNKDPETGEITSSLPNSRDRPSMERLVTADPTEVLKMNSLDSNANANTLTTETDESSSAIPTPEASIIREENAEEALNSLDTESYSADTTQNPPDTEDDVIQTHDVEVSKEERKKPAIGGSLYSSLLEATRELAVPVALTAMASMRTRKSKSRRRGTVKRT
jgi:hypothetical protein